METIINTRALDGECKKFASIFLGQIIIGKFENDDSEIISSYNIRKGNNITTIYSQLLRDNLCDVFRWMTSLPPAYLNSIDECGNLINRWEILWGSTKLIINKNKNEENTNYAEKEVYGTFKNLLKKSHGIG